MRAKIDLGIGSATGISADCAFMRYIKHVEFKLRLFPDEPEPSEPVCKPRFIDLPNARPVPLLAPGTGAGWLPWHAGYRDSLGAMACRVPGR